MNYLIIALLLLKDNGVTVSPFVWVIIAIWVSLALTKAWLEITIDQKKGGVITLERGTSYQPRRD